MEPIQIEKAIIFVRGHKVLLDSDLAGLYQVETKNLVKAVKRNPLRFPEDFMFKLTAEEYSNLRFQIGTSSQYGGRRYLPYAFMEQGVAMLSSVLHSERAIIVNVEIMRAFVRLREILSTHKELADKIRELEGKYDAQFKAVFQAIHALMETKANSRPIGFGFGDKIK